MKLLILALLPLLAYASDYDKACLDKDGNPISSKPFRIPNNCDGFYQCSNGYRSMQDCAPGTVFNRKIGVCDHPYNVPECKEYSVIACETKNAVVSCPAGSVIIVKDGFYGRDDDTTCPSSAIKTTDCSAKNSLKILKKNCHGENSCTLVPTNEVFGDPCVGTYKYIEMNFYCREVSRPSKFTTTVICEHESEEISCPDEETLWVKSASYGRTDDSTCPHKLIKDTSCSASGSLETIKDHCNGRNSCKVTASNFIFGDPCFGTYKYVEMTYRCRPSAWTTVTVCEHDKQDIACGENQEIRVRSAFYGRSNKATCSHPMIKTTSCSADEAFKTIRSNCHKKNSCTIHASNSVFGDPCFKTYKYAQVTYRCRDLPATDPCVDKNGHPISSDPFEKPGDCGHFYQCSNGDLYTMPCAPGTAFNPDLGVCDWPYNVPGCS